MKWVVIRSRMAGSSRGLLSTTPRTRSGGYDRSGGLVLGHGDEGREGLRGVAGDHRADVLGAGTLDDRADPDLGAAIGRGHDVVDPDHQVADRELVEEAGAGLDDLQHERRLDAADQAHGARGALGEMALERHGLDG